MKQWFCTILSIYLLVLAAMPCCDIDEMCFAHEMNGTAYLDKSHHQQEKDGRDVCSPFCTCNCCSIATNTIDLHAQNIQKPTTLSTERPTPAVIDNFVSSYCGDIWTPPKI